MLATIVQDNYLSSKLWAAKFEVRWRALQFKNNVVAMWDLVQVHLHQQFGINIHNVELQKFASKPCVVHPGSAELPLQWFECQPVVPRRLAIMTVFITSEFCITAMWTGDIWTYRGLLRKAGATSLPLCFNGCNVLMFPQS